MKHDIQFTRLSVPMSGAIPLAFLAIVDQGLEAANDMKSDGKKNCRQ